MSPHYCDMEEGKRCQIKKAEHREVGEQERP
jgi:hypothetical protein